MPPASIGAWPQRTQAFRRAAARVGAELLGGPRPRDDRRDRRGAGRSRAAARRPHRPRPQPLGVHARRGRRRARRGARRPGSASRASGSTCAATRARTRGSAPPTSSRSSRSTPPTWSGRGPSRGSSGPGSARWGCPCSSTSRRTAGRRSTGAAARRSSSGGSTPASSRPTSARSRLDPAAGGVIVGARKPLIAFNVNLRGPLEAAREIAAVVREAGGGFPGVRALGLELPRRGSCRCR